MALSSTAKGYIAEKIVGNLVLTASRGSLVPYLPVIDDAGVDLMVYSKGRNRVVRVQIKSRFATLSQSPNIVHFELRRKVFRSAKNLLILCCLIDPVTYVPKASWCIPSGAFARGARTSAKKLVIRPSIAADSRDRWARYRCLSTSALVRRIAGFI